MTDRKESPQYPAYEGETISGDRQADLATQGVSPGLATCDPVQSVPAQGILGSSTTCATTTERPDTGQSGSSRQLAAMPQPTSRRQRRKAATSVAEQNTPPEKVAVPQGSSVSSEAAAAGGGAADDRMDVGQTSASEADSPAGGSSDQGSVDEETLLHSPPQEMESEADTAPACSVQATTSGAAGGTKRKTGSGPTPPPKERKKRKRGPPLGGTFKQAEEASLLGVVLVQGQPYTILTRAQIEYVRSKLLTALVETANAGGTVPTFQESGIRHNRFHLSCTTRESYGWLRTTVDSLVVPVEGGTDLPLELVPASDVPQLLRAEVFISGSPPGVPKFLTLVKAQNYGLHTDRWVLRHQQTTPKGQLMIWGIDQESCTALAAVNYQPFFGLGRVTFRVSQRQAGANAGTQ